MTHAVHDAAPPARATLRRGDAPPPVGVAVALVVVLLANASAMGACAGSPDHERAAWLVNTLIEDNLELLTREPELCAGKFARMASSEYRFFRGTAGQYWRDVTSPGSPLWMPPPVGPQGTDVALVGDPHLENVGTFLDATGAIAIAYNDFDAALYGPWWADVRRLAASIGAATVELRLPPDPGALRDAAVFAAVDAYLARIEQGPAGASPLAAAGTVAVDLERRARRDGDAGEALAEYGAVDDGARTVYIGDVEPPDASGLFVDTTVAVDAATAQRVASALPAAAWSLTNPPLTPAHEFFEVRGVARRLGAGVSSYPILRWYAIVEGPTDALVDDVVIEIKEAREAPAGLASGQLRSRPWLNNAHRIVRAQREALGPHINVPLLGYLTIGSISFRISERTKYQKDFSLERFAERVADRDWTADDLVDFAAIAGAALAEAHCNAPTLSAPSGCAAIASSLAGDSTATEFIADTQMFAARATEVLTADFETYRAQRAARGPLLGARPSGDTP